MTYIHTFEQKHIDQFSRHGVIGVRLGNYNLLEESLRIPLDELWEVNEVSDYWYQRHEGCPSRIVIAAHSYKGQIPLDKSVGIDHDIDDIYVKQHKTHLWAGSYGIPMPHTLTLITHE